MSSATRSTDSTNAVAESMAGGEGFQPSRARDEPMTTHGHQPGQMTSEADKHPEFQAEVLPAGSAPADRTFKPNNISEVPPTESGTKASDTIGGATSSDVHTGLGHPGQGQSSNELHHAGPGKGGLEGTGASGVPSANLVDKRDPQHADQRTIGSEDAKNKNELGGEPAEGRLPGKDI